VACLALSHFPTLSHKRHDFRGEKILNIKCVFCFSLNLLSETFLTLRRIQPVNIINVQINSYCHTSMKLEFPLQIFEKSGNIKFHDNQSKWRRGFPSGQTEGRKGGRTCLSYLWLFAVLRKSIERQI